ncbi:beta-lactamase family protein [Aeromicrobium senzhongii]|uniref:Beta-lactamase family protein n=1 Tax=Aeromicrobium senzhongii TaxID=2663859 RepID=A0ABX6SP02_9ACTN|nr:serine hydrolase domain-containing protein [Aeromicrobium senzhongii]MTB87086.1 serine hydrolase [Aeromicrobium senzhongii]QNL93098.1 beta-lactamase family protein [Aeromicrobium senzhongii]
MTAVDLAPHLREVVGRMSVPGMTWAVVSGPRQTIGIGSAGPLGRDSIFRIASVTKPIVAVLTLRLAERGLFVLDEPIDRWLPEFADRRVLRARGAALDDTVPAARPTTVRDLLQMGSGFGWDMTATATDPLAGEFERRGLVSTWKPPVVRPDRWAQLAGPLPMAHQPGEGWLYQFSFDLLAVFLERVTRRRLDLVLRDEVLAPLDMHDTGYAVPMKSVDRVPSSWFPNRRGDFVEVAPIADPRLMNVPVFRSAATGLLSTADDLAKFVRMLLRGGRGPRGPVISAASFDALRTVTLGESARAMSHEFLEPGVDWGLGVGVDNTARYPSSHPGRFGWDGGTGTSLWVDPEAGVGGVLLTRQGMGTPEPPEYLDAFWRAVHA